MWYKIRSHDEGRGLNWVLGAGALRGGCGDSRAARIRAGLCHLAARVPGGRGGQGQWGAKLGSPGMKGMAQRWTEERDIVDRSYSPSHPVPLCPQVCLPSSWLCGSV